MTENNNNKDNTYIPSVDTLYESKLNQTILPLSSSSSSGWNESFPFLEGMEDSKKNLKKMCRKGIPPPLRQCVWLTNAILSSSNHKLKKESSTCQSLNPNNTITYSWNAAKNTTFSNNNNNPPTTTSTEEEEEYGPIPDFGLGQSTLQSLLSSGHYDFDDYEKETTTTTTTTTKKRKPTQEGIQKFKQILLCIQKLLNVEYCPLLPDLIAILLTHMHESFVYAIIRDFFTSSSSPSEQHQQHSAATTTINTMHYIAMSKVEHYSLCKTFIEVLKKMHPQMAERMIECGALSVEGLDVIFKRFFVTILRFEHVLRAMDIFTMEGSKFMIRFGIGLLEECKEIKHEHMENAESWWTKLKSITHNPNFKFDNVLKRAYGIRSIPVPKRNFNNKRIPKRSTIHRMVQSNQTLAKADIENDTNADITIPLHPPLDYVTIENIPSILIQPTSIRSNLAEWLPLGLKSSKLELIFSTDEHGRTLERFYSHVGTSTHTVTLVEVLQTGATIGMYGSQPWHVDSQIYGDGTCFLFRGAPDPICFKWKGGSGVVAVQNHKEDKEEEKLEKNTNQQSSSSPTINANGEQSLTMEELALVEHFMDGKNSHISMGINRDGGSGLWLNEDLTKGSSYHTVGFDNEPLAGEDLVDFDVGLVEVYRLVRDVDGKAI